MEAKHWAEAACSFVQTRNAMGRFFFLGSLHENDILVNPLLHYLTTFSVRGSRIGSLVSREISGRP